ncbi:DNA ligase-1 [Cyclobacterium lianum]|uniref:DNA ligase (ATP) n=1 Tax=Cyclobacterium lianum TaxID=388280 RepID=A0A1M7L566_9BACT|nr:ATP-dependent DNA ligase [Cyclobacterium lianum]SHM72939.1 DNA ligase-1 [Cyclobacterium lianum]
MKRFSILFNQLDQTNKTGDKLKLLESYFLEVSDLDRLWTLALFTHKRPRRVVNTRQLREWCCEYAGISSWLFEESYHTVGDLAETIALLLPLAGKSSDQPLHHWIGFLAALKDKEESAKKSAIMESWRELTKEERLVFNKLITGGFRVGVSQNLITRALASAFGLEKTEVAHRIMGQWDPWTADFKSMLLEPDFADDLSRPYPFFLAHPLSDTAELAGNRSDWQAEWKWDGIRGQIIKRKGETYIWSRGEELLTEKFPELEEMARGLPDGTVLDGEILPFENGKPLPFALLQTRIGRKKVSSGLLKKAPLSFMCYDLLECNGEDIRHLPLSERRKNMEKIVGDYPSEKLEISMLIEAGTWQELALVRNQSRENKAEGLMLKRIDSVYETGRVRGSWWKWKIEPLTIDGVMIYAQKGHGRRADLYSDYTLAVWKDKDLVPFAKAYSGLTDKEMKDVDTFVKKHTRERFGPVRTVKPELVFEIAFEGIQESPRHKSGIALRFPRIHRWRKDKPIDEANTLTDLQLLLEKYGK